MFDKLLKELKRLDRMKVSVPIKTDAEGCLDKECPSDNCKFQFKVFQEDWTEKFKDESVFCPLCGHNAPSDSFWTTEQIQHSREQASKYVHGRINKAITDDTRSFNRSQSRDSFIKMSMSYSGSGRTNHYILPAPAEKEFQQKITCIQCSAKYSVIGSAFFCPCCGHNSIIETFDNSIKKIETKLKNLDLVKKAVAEYSEDEAEVTIRSLIETSLSDGVVAFQRFCELTYKNTDGHKSKLKFNAFQNLEIGGKYWNELLGESYIDWLKESGYAKLNRLFQQRHLLSHCEGIVDEKYLENSGDTSYKVGQRIVVQNNDVQNLVYLIKLVINKIREIIGI